MDLPLQIGVAVYHLAELRMLNFLTSESEELHPPFKVDDKPFTLLMIRERLVCLKSKQRNIK